MDVMMSNADQFVSAEFAKPAIQRTIAAMVAVPRDHVAILSLEIVASRLRRLQTAARSLVRAAYAITVPAHSTKLGMVEALKAADPNQGSRLLAESIEAEVQVVSQSVSVAQNFSVAVLEMVDPSSALVTGFGGAPSPAAAAPAQAPATPVAAAAGDSGSSSTGALAISFAACAGGLVVGGLLALCFCRSRFARTSREARVPQGNNNKNSSGNKSNIQRRIPAELKPFRWAVPDEICDSDELSVETPKQSQPTESMLQAAPAPPPQLEDPKLQDPQLPVAQVPVPDEGSTEAATPGADESANGGEGSGGDPAPAPREQHQPPPRGGDGEAELVAGGDRPAGSLN